MRRAPARRRAIAGLALLLELLAGRAPASESATLEFLHIEANVGSSAGGHVALKLGDQVYHYENEGGFIRLVREGWGRFRYVYGELDNRDIHLARLRARDTDAQRVRDRLGLLFLVQNRHVEFLEGLERDRTWLRALAAGEPLELRGAGFFDRRPGESPALHALRGELSRRLGPGFLTRGRWDDPWAALPYPVRPADFSPPRGDRYPSYPPLFSERAEDLLARDLATRAIAGEWPLRDGALVAVTRPDGRPAPLSPEACRWLGAYRERLVDAIADGLRRERPGGGFPLLLALARYAAVFASLSTDRLLLLDALPPAHRAGRLTPAEERRPELQLLLIRLRAELPGFQRAVFALAEPDEAAYGQLESRAAELREIERGLSDRRPIRYARRDTPPEGWGTVRPRLPAGFDPERAELVAAERADAFRQRLETLYPYQLIGRNCVTELLGAVESAFPTSADAAAALGGRLEAGARLSFIPQRFFTEVRRRYRVESVAVLPSHRHRMLGELTRWPPAWPILAAEASPWTSSFYQPQPGDTSFLLFTEDWVWPRPLFGAINLAYGLGGGALGLLTAPVDGGRRLREGLAGAVFSLPELFFGNIRKGSFDVIRGREGPAADSGH